MPFHVITHMKPKNKKTKEKASTTCQPLDLEKSVPPPSPLSPVEPLDIEQMQQSFPGTDDSSPSPWSVLSDTFALVFGSETDEDSKTESVSHFFRTAYHC